MSRQAANIQICNKLRQFFEEEDHKDLRFFQGLFALSLLKQNTDSTIQDPFNEESYTTIKNIYFQELLDNNK